MFFGNIQFFSYFLTETQQSCCHSLTSQTACLAGLSDPAYVRAPSTSRLPVAGVKGLQGSWLLILPSTKLNAREPGSRLSGLWSSMGCFILCAEVWHWWGWLWSGHCCLFSCWVIFSWSVIHSWGPFQCQGFLLFFRASDFPAELEIQVLIHPEAPHLSIGKHSVFISGKSGSYQREIWLHLITMNYWSISERQRESTASRQRCFLGLQYLRMRKLHCFTKSKYFCCILVLYVFWGEKKQLNLSFSILCLTLFKTLALGSEDIIGRVPAARGSVCWSSQVAFVHLSSAAAELVRMRTG